MYEKELSKLTDEIKNHQIKLAVKKRQTQEEAKILIKKRTTPSPIKGVGRGKKKKELSWKEKRKEYCSTYFFFFLPPLFSYVYI